MMIGNGIGVICGGGSKGATAPSDI